MKTGYRWALVLLAVIITAVVMEWALQAIAFNAACKYGDAACISTTSDSVTLRGSLSIVSLLVTAGSIYFARR